MKSIAELLREKNQCLEKFYRLNERELTNFCDGKFDRLEEFYSSREGLLEIVKKIDEMIEKSNQLDESEGLVDTNVRDLIQAELDFKSQLVNRILEQDLKILAAIESAKSDIIKELCQVRATKKAVSSYKSGRADARLDEEA